MLSIVLFEDIERTSPDVKSNAESDWSFLNRSDWVESERIRSFLNLRISEFPPSERNELISRIQTGDDGVFQSTVFELIVFAMLRSQGYEVTVHPSLPNGSAKRPDFLAVSPEGQSVYVECIVASEFAQKDVAARKRTAVIMDAIEKVESPDFFIGVEVESNPKTPPSGKKLRARVNAWILELDPDLVSSEYTVSGIFPKLDMEIDGWKISFEAIPKDAEKRAGGQRTIGYQSGGMEFTSVDRAIRKAIKSKGSRYGELPHPLIVAVNAGARSVDDEDEIAALFGQEEWILDTASGNSSFRRKPNGAWQGPTGPQYTRVSGAWIFRNVSVWTIAHRGATLYFNPWAALSLPNKFSDFDHAKVVENELSKTCGISIREMLNLPENWPS